MSSPCCREEPRCSVDNSLERFHYFYGRDGYQFPSMAGCAPVVKPRCCTNDVACGGQCGVVSTPTSSISDYSAGLMPDVVKQETLQQPRDTDSVLPSLNKRRSVMLMVRAVLLFLILALIVVVAYKYFK